MRFVIRYKSLDTGSKVVLLDRDYTFRDDTRLDSVGDLLVFYGTDAKPLLNLLTTL
jgi:hypothetical protein